MKLINPIGRTITGTSSVSPSACMCNTDSSFATGQGGSSDSCWHCGCECEDTQYAIGNNDIAIRTIRTSNI